MNKLLYGVGYFGEGNFKSRTVKGVIDREYTAWQNMLQRCYSEKYHESQPHHKGCSVATEWLDYQNFAQWITTHKNWGKSNFTLDKDLTVIGNKVYSPKTCYLIPRQVNSLILSKTKDKELPMGVTVNKFTPNTYQASCGDGEGKLVIIGRYPCIEQARLEYIKFKKEVIIKVTNKFKDDLSDTIYRNLINYPIELLS